MMVQPLDPSPLIQLATAYWGSATLLAAVRLKIFDALARGPRSSEALAGELGADPIAMDTLLTALTSLELIERGAEGFQNLPLAASFLVSGQPSSLGEALLYNGDVYPLWGQLDEVIQRGDSARDPEAYLGEDTQKTRHFVYGMHRRALGVGRAVAATIRLDGTKRLADIGGGPGTYSALLCKKTEGLSADVLDLPGVVAVSAEIISEMGLSERVHCRSFDYYRDQLDRDRYDAALISGVLHREQPAQVKKIFADVAAALPTGARLYISDVMLNDDRSGPLFSAMFALNMRVLSHDGRCHSVAEQRAWLEEVGFRVHEVYQLPAPIHYTVIEAERV
ncbi:MAG: methyltransferase [Myxococcota bacterium]|nr:methyltransferase [Myxococcota bacterium]